MCFLFTTGEKYFALIFAFIFLIAMFFAYRKDFKYTSQNYKKVYLIFLGIAVFLFIILLMAKR